MNQGKCPGRSLYADGKYVYQSKEALLNFLIEHMPNPEGLPAEELHSQYDAWISAAFPYSPMISQISAMPISSSVKRGLRVSFLKDCSYRAD